MLGLVAAAVAVAGGLAIAQVASPLVAAHRGGALLWPENSLTAFENALALGADFLETDVHLTRDGEVVVLHDPTLERTTTGAGRVSEASRADLASLRLRARDGATTPDPIPTLSQLLDLLVPSRAHLLLEIKVGADRQRYPGIEEKVLALVRTHRLIDRTVVMAFEEATVRRIRALDPSMRTALLVGQSRVQRERVPSREAVRWAQEVGASHLGIDHRVLDPGVVEAARAAGIVLATWTVNDEADLRRVMAARVDVIISDRPDLALRLR
ncbi:MAG: glycerophosphodiester phosphodiesterase [Candidatus Rokuibacteriota bacterium]